MKLLLRLTRLPGRLLAGLCPALLLAVSIASCGGAQAGPSSLPSWHPMPIPGAWGLRFIALADAQRGWAGATSHSAPSNAAANPTLFQTVDGGHTWRPAEIAVRGRGASATLAPGAKPGTLGFVYDMAFVGDGVGWAAGMGIARTDDSGRHWRLQYAHYAPVLFFLDERTGWAITYNQRETVASLVRTVDGGEHWRRSALPARVFPFSLFFASEREGWAVGVEEPKKGVILHTQDGGMHWTKQLVASRRAFQDAVFIDARRGWVESRNCWSWPPRPRLLFTSDGGKTWHEDPRLPTRASVIAFADSRHGWAGGDGIYATSDGGQTWHEQYSTGKFGVTGFCFMDPSRGFAVGNESGGPGSGFSYRPR